MAALRLAVPKAVEALNRQLDAAVAQLRQLEGALDQVQRGAAGDGRSSQEQLQLAVQLEDSLCLLTTNKCSVVSEGEGGSTWKADVQLGGFGDVFRLLLLQLRADGQLAKVSHQPGRPSLLISVWGLGLLFIRCLFQVDDILCPPPLTWDHQ